MAFRTALWRVLAALVVLAACASRPLSAHEVPNDVTIQAYFKADGTTLRILVRAPLLAMRDMTWPFRSPGLLDLARADFELHNAATLWLGDEVRVYEGGTPLASQRVVAVRATAAGDRSFETYDRALALVTGPREADATDVSINEGFLDVLFEYPIQSAASRFSIEPRWGRLGIRSLTIVQWLRPDGGIRRFELQGDPGVVRLDPEWQQAARQFSGLGFGYILNQVDHLLFLVGLVLPFRRVRQVAIVAGAFAVGHSATLAAAVYGLTPAALWFPPLIAALVAATIVYVAVENIIGTTLHRRWMTAAVFGMIHGFAWSFGLQPSLQLSGNHFFMALLSFTLGIEAGLLLTLALAVPAVSLLFRYAISERVGVLVISALMAHTGWHWLTARGTTLRQYQFSWPEMTPAFFADLLRLAMVVVAVTGLLWLVSVLTRGGRDAEARG